jgi:hypothetical protein
MSAGIFLPFVVQVCGVRASVVEENKEKFSYAALAMQSGNSEKENLNKNHVFHSRKEIIKN